MQGEPNDSRWRTAAILGVGALLLLLLCSLSIHSIWNADYWWQWKTGEYVIAHGVPHTDVFSYTAPGRERLELRWLYCLGLFETSRWFGRGSAVLLKCLFVVAAFAVVGGIAARKTNLLTVGVVTAIAAVGSSQRFYVRPEIVSYLFFAIWLALIDRAQRGPTRWIFLLLPLQVLWVNSHGLFILGPALLAAWATSELAGLAAERLGRRAADDDRRRRLLIASGMLLATLLVSLINPYLHRGLLLPLVQFGELHSPAMKAYYAELMSPFAFPGTYTAVVYYKVLIGLAGLSVLFNLRRQRLFWLIVASAMLYLSATSIRNLPLFCMAAVPFVVRNLSESAIWRRSAVSRRLPTGRAIGAVALAVFCAWQSWQLFTNRFYVRQGASLQSGMDLAEHRYPVRATEFFKAAGVTGPIFNASAAGSYLLARDIPVFIDPRGEIYMDDVFLEYRRMVDDPSTIPEYAPRYGFEAFFLESAMIPMIVYLSQQPNWRLVYVDEVATIFLRSDVAPGIPRLDLRSDGERWLAETRRNLREPPAYAERRWNESLTPPNAYAGLGRLLLAMRSYGQARALFEDALRAFPPGFNYYGELAYATMQAGDVEAATAYFDQAVARQPGRPELRKRAAEAWFRLGEYDRAAAELEAFFATSTDDAEAFALRGVVELRRQHPAEAAQWLARAIELQPQLGANHYFFGEAMFQLGRPEQALAALDRAYRINPRDLRTVIGLIRVNASLGRSDAARRFSDEALRLAPDDPTVQQLTRELGVR
jgi:tetratricopeptide (TPR) repeat protein